MVTLTSLPISLQSRILMYLCDEPLSDEYILRRAQVPDINYCIPLRHPETQFSLDHVPTANTLLPSQLLSPALASPILAAAAFRLVRNGMLHLTDANTEGRLPQWVKVFSRYVQAVSITDVAEVWKDSLPGATRTRMAEKCCFDAVALFREITLNHVRLKVLDVVHLPFDDCGEMQDVMLAGLCTTLESCQSTLKELALPVYLDSDLCAVALKSITLPHLTVFSIEVKAKRLFDALFSEEGDLLSLQCLRMVQAVDGHADRRHGLTTLQELKLINFYVSPRVSARGFGCSAGFFRAIKILRVSSNQFCARDGSWETSFLYSLKELERLYWMGTSRFGSWSYVLESLSNKFKELHLCPHHWVKGVQFREAFYSGLFLRSNHAILNTVRWGKGKIRTLVCYSELSSFDVRLITRKCPNLRYLSLLATSRNVHELGRLIRKCEQLTGLEIIINEVTFGRLGKDGWMEIGNAIPRNHANLRDLAIRTHWGPIWKVIPRLLVIDCFVEAIERIGARLERLTVQAILRFETSARLLREVCRILDTCLEHSTSLSQLEVCIVPCNCLRKCEDRHDLASARAKLRSSARTLIRSRPHLTKIDLGLYHYALHDLDVEGGRV